jgi:GT2 family glycosyltransferase
LLLIDDEGKKLNDEYVGRPRRPQDKHGNISLTITGNFAVSDYPLVRKEIIEKVGFFNEEMIATGEDVEYWNRASFHTKFYYFDLLQEMLEVL